MSNLLKVNDIIQVRTGDYLREWADAKITHVWAEPRGLSFDVTFEKTGYKQHVTDVFGLSKDEWRYKPTVVNELEDRIRVLRKSLTGGKRWFNDGKAETVVQVSELNDLFRLVDEINNYRLNCLWNQGKVSKHLDKVSNLWYGVETGNVYVDSPEFFDKMKSIMAEVKGDES